MKYMPVIDIESTSWGKGEIPAGQVSETIQIGMVMVDLENLTIHPKELVLYIRPEHSRISPFLQDLCGIKDPDYYYQAPTFLSCCAVLQEELQERWEKPLVWGSWGDYDRKQIHRDCVLKHANFPLPAQHVNIKEMEKILNGREKGVGLRRAVRRSTGKDFEGTQHFSVDDARNTAVVLINLLRRDKVRLDDFIVEENGHG